MTTPTCDWRRLNTGERLCDQPARYHATYDACDNCDGPCPGGLVCTEHAAQIREGAGEDGLRELRLLPGVPMSGRSHVRPGRRGASSALPTPRLGNGEHLTPAQLRRIDTCAQKIPYTCQTVAETAAIALGWCGIDVEVYRCDCCDLFHLTHARKDH